MREGPSESGSRTRLQTAQCCTRATARVVSDCGKGERQARQVTSQKTKASEPPTRCRNRIVNAIETRLLSRVWDKIWEAPVFCPDGGRHAGGVSWERGGWAERGNLVPAAADRYAFRAPQPEPPTSSIVGASWAPSASQSRPVHRVR